MILTGIACSSAIARSNSAPHGLNFPAVHHVGRTPSAPSDTWPIAGRNRGDRWSYDLSPCHSIDAPVRVIIIPTASSTCQSTPRYPLAIIKSLFLADDRIARLFWQIFHRHALGHLLIIFFVRRRTVAARDNRWRYAAVCFIDTTLAEPPPSSRANSSAHHCMSRLRSSMYAALL